MAGKIQAGRNVVRLSALHATVADMMAEAGYGCDGKPLKEAAGQREPAPPPTTIELGEARTLLETVLVRSDSVDAKRDALRCALRDLLRVKMKTPEMVDRTSGPWVWIRDLFDEYVVFEVDDSSNLFQCAYTADMSQDPPVITLGDAVAVEIAYVPKAGEVDATEAAIEVEYVPLVERAISKDGTMRLKLIDPGWGSSGFYSEAVLKRDGPKVFTPGLKMYLDHPTPTEEAERPERSVKDLAAVLKTPAQWDPNGPKGPGLYAEAKVVNHAADLEAIADDIGVSIRAAGRAAPGTAEGRTGLIIQEISSARSVDFVTDPGRGGRILALAESRRQQQPTGGDPKSKEKSEMQLTESEKALQGQITTLTESLTQLTGVVGALAGSVKLGEARTFVRQHLPASLPEPVAARIVEAQAASAPTKEDGTLDAEAFTARIKEAVKTEVDYLRGLGALGPSVTGMGETFQEAASEVPKVEDSQKVLEEAFQDLGMSEKTAKRAAEGK